MLKKEVIIVLYLGMSYCINFEFLFLLIVILDKLLEVLWLIIESFCLVCNFWIIIRIIIEIWVEGYEYLIEVV